MCHDRQGNWNVHCKKGFKNQFLMHGQWVGNINSVNSLFWCHHTNWAQMMKCRAVFYSTHNVTRSCLHRCHVFTGQSSIGLQGMYLCSCTGAWTLSSSCNRTQSYVSRLHLVRRESWPLRRWPYFSVAYSNKTVRYIGLDDKQVASSLC